MEINFLSFSIQQQQKAFSSLVNRSRVVFELPTVGSSCPGDEEELVDGPSYSSAVARTTTSGSERSVVDVSSEKRNQCATDPPLPDRKTKNNSTNKKAAAVVSLVAVEFLLDQQRSFLPSSRLQPFQV